MPFFTSPTSFLQASRLYYSNNHDAGFDTNALPAALDGGGMAPFTAAVPPPHSSHPSVPHLVLLVFEAVLEVVCVSLPGYIVAHMGMFDADAQKFVANLNVMLFTPCLSTLSHAYAIPSCVCAELTDLHFCCSLYQARVAVDGREIGGSGYHPVHLRHPVCGFVHVLQGRREVFSVQETAVKLCHCHGGEISCNSRAGGIVADRYI